MNKNIDKTTDGLMNKIIVNELHFSYSDTNEDILKGITMNFDGRSTAIVGQNGAGKTTFVKLLKGLLKPSSGSVKICGIDTNSSTAAKLSKYIGLVFQNPNDQIFKGKVIDEVKFGPLNIGKTDKEATEKSLEALEMVGLKHLIDENPYDLDLAERKLISIASIVAMDTAIIIFDEPTIAQDYLGEKRISEIIKKLEDMGKLVITIIHDMDFAAENFKRIVVFSEGKILLDGSPREVFSKEEDLKNAYLEPPHVTMLCQKLGYKETFLTVDEFIEFRKNKM